VLATREVVAKGAGSSVIATYKDGSAAMISKSSGKGVVYYAGMLPGQAYVRKGLMPARPMGKGGPEWNFSQWEPLNYDENAASVILQGVASLAPDAMTNRRGVVANVLESKDATLVTVINLAKLTDGKAKEVEITLPGAQEGK